MFPEWIILFDWGRFKFKVESKNKQQLFKKNYIFLFQKLSIFLLIRSTWEHYLPGICPQPWHLLLSRRTPWALKTGRQQASALEWRRASQPSRAVTGAGWLEEEVLIWSRSRPRTAPAHSEVKLHAITYPVTTPPNMALCAQECSLRFCWFVFLNKMEILAERIFSMHSFLSSRRWKQDQHWVVSFLENITFLDKDMLRRRLVGMLERWLSRED